MKARFIVTPRPYVSPCIGKLPFLTSQRRSVVYVLKFFPGNYLITRWRIHIIEKFFTEPDLFDNLTDTNELIKVIVEFFSGEQNFAASYISNMAYL